MMSDLLNAHAANKLLKEIAGRCYKKPGSLIWAMKRSGFQMVKRHGIQHAKYDDVVRFAKEVYGRRRTKPGRSISVGKNRFGHEVQHIPPREAVDNGRAYVMPSDSPPPWLGPFRAAGSGS